MIFKIASLSKEQFRFLLISFFFSIITVNAQTVVNSLQALKPYLNDNNVNVKLEPGTYWITEDDAKDGLYDEGTDIIGRLSKSLLLFEGNNSTYDFTGVTINVETAVFKAYGSSYQVYEVHTIGNNNTIKNLTLVDVGSVDDNPSKGANSIVMDGADNTIEGFHCTIKGSFPYGYGDSFGKGGGAVISHRKHSACLVRGNSNTVRNSTFIHRSYGHCIYFQAASRPTIEGCYVEGEMRSTDDMLAEEGTGSPADDVDFMTVWGYRLPAGYMMSTGEAGIRAYNAGETLIDGVEYDRGTDNPTIKNCTVKNMRTGVTLTHATGTKIVEGVTVIGCEQGFAIGAGTVEDCYADVAFGPAYQSTYNNDNGFHADITIIPAENGFYYNGSKSVAYIGGSNHNVILRNNDPNINPELTIQMGGVHENIRFLNGSLESQNNHIARNINLQNYTGYTVLLPSESYDNDIQSCGSVVNQGSDNNVDGLDGCEAEIPSSTCGGFNAFSTIQGEAFCDTKGAKIAGTGDSIGSIFDGDWVKYDDVEFGNNTGGSIEIVLGKAHEGNTEIDIYVGSLEGKSLGTIEVPYTGGWYTWQTVFKNIDDISGTHDVYLSFSNSDPSTGVANVESFRFIEAETRMVTIDNNLEVEATLLFSEEFNNNLSNWVVEAEEPETVKIENGKLDIEVISGCVLWYKEWLKGPIMIEFDAVPIDEGGDLDRVSDLNSFVLASDLDGNPADFFDDSEERSENEAHLSLYDPFGMYYVGHGGGNNSRIRFRRYDGEGERPLLPEHDLPDEEYRLQANENHHIQIIVYGNRFQYYANGQLIYDWEDPNTPYSEGYYGFRTTTTHWQLDNYKFYSLSDESETTTPSTQSFTPDPNKTYYIDAPYHNLRLAANGSGEDTYTTSTNTTGADVEWRFVQNDNGYWHIQRAAGGTVPRLRTDNSEFADMQGTAWSGIYTYYDITTGYIDNTYFLTLPDGPAEYQRLQVNNEGNARFVPTSHALTWESFEITEVPNSTILQSGNLAVYGTATQSTTDYDGVASRAIDGNTNGIYSNESVTHTATNGENAWWQVDLGSNQSIDSIVVWNRTDSCCSSRLSSFKIVVLNSNGQVAYERTLNDFTPNPSYTTSPNGAVGRYVRIELTEPGALSLAEVEVFGNGFSNKNILEDVAGRDVVIYPNPVESITTISGAVNSILRIYDINGRLLLMQNVSSENEQINLEILSTGIYYAQISSIDTISVLKIIKQ